MDLRLGVMCLGAIAAAAAFLGGLGERLVATAVAVAFGGFDLRLVPIFPLFFDETITVRGGNPALLGSGVAEEEAEDTGGPSGLGGRSTG